MGGYLAGGPGSVAPMGRTYLQVNERCERKRAHTISIARHAVDGRHSGEICQRRGEVTRFAAGYKLRTNKIRERHKRRAEEHGTPQQTNSRE